MSGSGFKLAVLAFAMMSWAGSAIGQAVEDRVEKLFEPDHTNLLVMRVEAAIALSQAELGLIPIEAAREIDARAQSKYAPLEDVQAEYQRVRHRMVALLNVWRRSLSPEASDALHLGVTTVDIYDTVMILQLLEASELMLKRLRELEQNLICMAMRHRGTPMIGRTLGQHALPITFGKKVAVWAAQTRRNIERLQQVESRLRASGVLKGAVGTHLGLGEHGIAVEQGVSRRLGLNQPAPADWRAARDVFAEYAQILALVAKSLAGMGGEIFRLQMTDIGELYERRSATAVGSSTMPHKRNPSLSEALIHHGRIVPALARVLLDDVESTFERDNTSRPNRTMAQVTTQAAGAVDDAVRLISRLEINTEQMRANLDRTDGMILSQRIVLYLADKMSRDEAEQRVREAAERSLEQGQPFRSSLLADPVLNTELSGVLESLLDPETYLGLAAEQVDDTAEWIDQQRSRSDEPRLQACADSGSEGH